MTKRQDNTTRYRSRHKKIMAKYRIENKETINASNAAYRSKHKEAIKTSNAAYQREHKEAIKASNAAYRSEHKEAIKASNAAYRSEHKEVIKVSNAAYRSEHKEAIKASNTAYQRKHKEVIKASDAAYRSEHKEAIKASNAAYQKEHKEAIKSSNSAYWTEHKDDLNDKRRTNQFKQFKVRRTKEFERKGDFSTKVKEIPCDTTDYEIAPNPETAVMNWYQSTEHWRLVWPMEDLQALIDNNSENSNEDTIGANNADIATNTNSNADMNEITELLSEMTTATEHNIIDDARSRLNERIEMEKVTPIKQRQAAQRFFRAVGRGYYWADDETHKSYTQNSVDALLYGCACCGMKDYNGLENSDTDKQFKHVALSKLSILKLDEQEEKDHKKHINEPVNVPVNDEGNWETVYPWRAKSICSDNIDPSDFNGPCKLYYLHPELVVSPKDVAKYSEPMAVICSDCLASINKKEIPHNCIADKVDFGLGRRVGLTDLSLRELHIIAYVRYYYNIIKIESSSRKLKEHQQSAIKGSSILFEQDAPQVVSKLLSPETMNSNVFLHFVGYKGEFDALYKKTMQSKTADVFGRSWAIYQWLMVLHYINNLYQNLTLPTFDEFKHMMDKATESFISQSLKTFDDDERLDEVDQMKDDIAGVRATTNVNMQINEGIEENYTSKDDVEEFTLKHCYLANANKTSYNSNSDSTQMYLLNAAKALGINVESEREEYNKAKSFRAQYPINEFTEGEYGMVGAFPHVFLFGKGYRKNACNLNLNDCAHLLMQFHDVPATCQMLLFYLYDVQRRHGNIRGMSTRRKADPKAFDNFATEFMSDKFQAMVQNAVADPNSKDLKYVCKKLLPILAQAGKNTVFGPMERNSSLGEQYAMIRRLGPQFVFLTITFDDVSCPSVFRLTFSRLMDNLNWPCIAPQEFLTAMENRTPFATGNVTIPTNWSALAKAVTNNPVASAFFYKRLIFNIVTILVGLKPSRFADGRNNRKISPRYTPDSVNEEGGVIAGHVSGYNGCHECSARGGLHAHIQLWSAIGPALLQGVAEMKDVCTKVTEVLDSMFDATLPREYHVKDLIEKELLFYSTKSNPYEKEIRRGRAMLIHPDPLQRDEFDNFVHDTINTIGVHSHDKNIRGRCHKPPKGITKCALAKPSGLNDRTKPVQLVDITPKQSKPAEKITVTFQATANIESHKSALQRIAPQNSAAPFRECDPRLIVYEPKRPVIEPLPDQDEDASKEWIIFQLSHAMAPMIQQEDTSVTDHSTAETDKPSNNHSTASVFSVTDITTATTRKRKWISTMDDDDNDEDLLTDHNYIGKNDTKNPTQSCLKQKEHKKKVNTIITSPLFHKCNIPYQDEIIELPTREVPPVYGPFRSALFYDESNHVSKYSALSLEFLSLEPTTLHVTFDLPKLNGIQYSNKNKRKNRDELTDDDISSMPITSKKTRIENPHAPSPTFRDTKSRSSSTVIIGADRKSNDDACNMSTSRKYRSFMDKSEINSIITHLKGMDVDDLRTLYDTIKLKLSGRNGYVVDYNPILTAILGCHTNSLLLGSSEQSKVAAHYLGPYVDKNKTPLAEAMDVVYEATEHAKKYPSIAEDTGTISRFVQLVMTKILNKLGNLIEISDTQAAAALLSLQCSLCSESFTVCDTESYMNFIKNEKKCADLADNNDLSGDDSSEYYDSSTSTTSYKSEVDETEETENENHCLVEDENEPDQDDNIVNTEGILSSLLNSADMRQECESNTMLHRIQEIVNRTDEVLSSPQTKFYGSSYGSCPLYKVDDGHRLVAIPYAYLYRYRGWELRKLNRIEYYSTILIRKDRPDDNDLEPPHVQYKRGRKRAHIYRFGRGIEIGANHHQVFRAKLCTPKFFKTTPRLPGKRPSDTKENEAKLKLWNRRAKKFAWFYLTLFRPETELYEEGQQSNYSYEWKDLENFVEAMNESRGKSTDLAIHRFRLDYMTNMIHGLNSSHRSRLLLSAYRERNATKWSEEEQYEAEQKYRHRMRKNNNYFTDDDVELENQMNLGLNSAKEQEIMQKVAFTNGLLNQLRQYTGEYINNNNDDNEESNVSEDTESEDVDMMLDEDNNTVYPVESGRYNATVAQSALDVADATTLQEEEEMCDDCEHDVPPSNIYSSNTNNNVNDEDLDTKIRELINSQHLSQDKLCTVQLMCEHFKMVRNGSAMDKSYKAPLLLITGGPGVGKSFLIRSITDLADLMELATPIKTAFMGIAAINIGGYTLNSFLDVPLEMSAGVGTTKRIIPWDPDKLLAFKQKYDVTNLSALIIDEISMVKPWMLAYLDERLKEATQVYDKPFGGVAVIMFGDFDQQPPIGGSSMPSLSMTLLEKEYQRKHKIYFTKDTRKDKVEINSTLCRQGVRLFEQAGHLKLTTQHRCAKDPDHMANLLKMNSGAKMNPSDLSLYKTLTDSDLKDPKELLFSTIIVTGNHERQEINAFVAGVWARTFGTHVIRWKRQIKEDRWKGRPRSDEALKVAEKQACFYELFVPKAPAYLVNKNLNLHAGLANGTPVREHSLAFEDSQDKAHLDSLIRNTPVGGVIDLPAPPTAINVELYPDYPSDSQETKTNNAKLRETWTRGSIVRDGRIVIPIDKNTGKFRTESIQASVRPYHFSSSTVPMADHFPIELGFCITVPKSQGRTIRKVIASLSKHPTNFLRLKWEQLYTVLSRIEENAELKLLLQMGNRNTLEYISDLEKDPKTTYFFAGYPRESNNEVVYWDPLLAATAAGFREDEKSNKRRKHNEPAGERF